jgi:hypothetical protein
MRTAFLLLGAAFLSAVAVAAPPSRNVAGEAALAKALAGYVPAGKTDCVRLTDLGNQTIIDRTAILYQDGSRIYVNRPNGADQLGRDNILIMHPLNGQACSLDIIRLRDNGSHFESGSVSLNDFEIYTRAPKP